jgi:hypothetical protein
VYYFAAFFSPGILLFHFYNRNHVFNHIVFGEVLVLAGIFAVFGLLLFLAFKFVAGSEEGALLLAVLFWLCFWLFEILFNVTERYLFTLTPSGFMVLLGVGLVSIAAFFHRYRPPFAKVRPAFNALALSLIALFIFNLIPGVSHNLVLNRARAEIADADEGALPFYIKRNFHIDTTLPAPDIYWFHVDGMMSLETVERFWGKSQEHLRTEFTRRGFIVYENAQLNAGFTDSAFAALLFPAFYDSFWGERLAEVAKVFRLERQRFLVDELAQVGLTLNDLQMPNSELVSALVYRRYAMRGIHRIGSFYHFYFIRRDNRFLTGDLLDLLRLTTPLNIPPPTLTERVAIEQQSYNDPEPLARFTWRSLVYTHMNDVWQQDPTMTELDYTAVHLYPLAYEHMAQRIFHFVDIVLEANPNAVIVLQSDHGFHMQPTQQYLLNEGNTLDQVLELIHSVFSAVRIPSQYGGLEAPIAPLNISRELVNRFVGQNYNLLP